MSRLVKPHGDVPLKPLLLVDKERDEERARAAKFPRVAMRSRELGDLAMLGIGGFSPLYGFMTEADWRSVCDDYRLRSGLFWPIPITLSADAASEAIFRSNIRTSTLPHHKRAQRSKGAPGRRSRRSRPGIPCIAPTSIWSRLRWKCATAC